MAGKSRFLLWLVASIGLLIFGYNVQAQTDTPNDSAPQFLYRNGKNLLLVNAETGDATTLAGIVAGDRDQFTWSPNGRFVIVQTAVNSETWPNSPYCLNLYDVDERKMLYDKPLACEIDAVGMSNDSAQIAYATRTTDGENSILWLQSITDTAATQIYQTAGVYTTFPNGIDDIQWSPNDHYMSFVSYEQIESGSNNDLHIFNPQTRHEYSLTGGLAGYYATYDPIWSPDENWFLLDLKDEYVTSGALPETNDKGDLYLVRSDTGELHRLTFTPAEKEFSPHWTQDGQIVYGIVQNVQLTVNDALNLQTPSPDSIVEPEPIDETLHSACSVSEESPYSSTLAEICPSTGDLSGAQEFDITFNGEQTYEANLPSENYNNALIGWRALG